MSRGQREREPHRGADARPHAVDLGDAEAAVGQHLREHDEQPARARRERDEPDRVRRAQLAERAPDRGEHGDRDDHGRDRLRPRHRGREQERREQHRRDRRHRLARRSPPTRCRGRRARTRTSSRSRAPRPRASWISTIAGLTCQCGEEQERRDEQRVQREQRADELARRVLADHPLRDDCARSPGSRPPAARARSGSTARSPRASRWRRCDRRRRGSRPSARRARPASSSRRPCRARGRRACSAGRRSRRRSAPGSTSGLRLEAVVPPEPEVVAPEVDHELALRADRADLELVAVVEGAGVVRRAGHRPDRAVVVADHDRVVVLDRRVEDRLHQRERRVAAQPGQPERDAERVRELRLAVAAAVRAGRSTSPARGPPPARPAGTRRGSRAARA